VFNFFKNNSIDPIKIAAMLVHAAKIDQNYTTKEKEIIKKTLLKLEFNEENLDKLINDAEKLENDSNQILDFTKEIKNIDEESKKKIFESLWNIIYSDEKADIYEDNLMRRLSGLLYLDSKVAGNIKEKVKLKLSK
tara:strand:- start:63 stop:470 length:408 start_codon:yes stop_codon:yes gene_type:complete